MKLPRVVLSLLASLTLTLAAAAAPCGSLLSTYLEPNGGEVLPCLVDLQEAGLCFRLPGITLETATRTLDAHLQEQGVPRPVWTSTRGANGSLLAGPGGDRIEIVIAQEGPFATTGTCRIMPDR